jgi:hypothetical protein
MVGDAHDVARFGTGLGAHAGKSAGAALEVGHAHDIVEGHPQREEARAFAGQRTSVPPLRIGALLCRAQARDPLQVKLAVGGILEFDDAGVAQRDEIGSRRRRDGASVT